MSIVCYLVFSFWLFSVYFLYRLSFYCFVKIWHDPVSVQFWRLGCVLYKLEEIILPVIIDGRLSTNWHFLICIVLGVFKFALNSFQPVKSCAHLLTLQNVTICWVTRLKSIIDVQNIRNLSMLSFLYIISKWILQNLVQSMNLVTLGFVVLSYIFYGSNNFTMASSNEKNNNKRKAFLKF